MPVKNKVFITGPPASGKTMIIRKIVDEALLKSVVVKGFFTPEIRKDEVRVGFYIERIPDTETVTLASRITEDPNLPKYGKYYLNPRAADFIHEILMDALGNAELIVIDEIGPMELAFPKARKAMIQSITSDKPVIGVVHRNLRNIDPSLYRLIRNHKILFVNRNTNNEVLQELRVFLASLKQ